MEAVTTTYYQYLMFIKNVLFPQNWSKRSMFVNSQHGPNMLWRRYYESHFTDDETEEWNYEEPGPRLHKLINAGAVIWAQ